MTSPVVPADGTALARDLSALAGRAHDLLVLGGGIYGVTAAFEAARRGLRVALVEADDFGSGASWNSLKTIHGGLRHLQRLDLASQRESVRERRHLLRVAPALVRPLRFLVPAYGHGPKGREALAAGLLLDRVLALDRNVGLAPERALPESRMLKPDEVLRLVPGLSSEGLSGAAVWADAQVESTERLTIGYLRAAAAAGAVCANHTPAVALLVEEGRVRGARVRDLETGVEHEVRAAFVLDAARPHSQGLLAAGEARPGRPEAAPPPSEGWLAAMNLVYAGPWPLGERLGVGARSRGRYLFLVPWRDRILAGTDYRAAGEAGARAAVDSFRTELEQAFPWAGLAAREVTLVHRGLVPGAAGPEGLATTPRVVDHAEEGGADGLLSVEGVKYTTARAVSERLVDLVASRLGRPEARRSPDRRSPAPDPLEWARPLEGSLAERTRLAVRDEMARRLCDAVLRRLDLGTGGPPGEPEAEEVAGAMARELGWDEGRRRAERRALAGFYEAAYNGTRAP